MIRSITVINPIGESLQLILRSPEQSGFLVQPVEGLGPNAATINMTEMATTDGALYTSARVPYRNIVLPLKFLPNPTIEDTRQLSYRLFPTKKKVQLIFETDRRLCVIAGYVESNTPDIFTNSSGTQISLLCMDPYFYDLTPRQTTFSGTYPNLEFPVENPSLEDPEIEFGVIDLETIRIVPYEGDVDAGIIAHITFQGTATNIAIQNTFTGEVMHIDTAKIEASTGEAVNVGDEIIISTTKGEKFIYLLRDGVYTNILHCLDKDSDWITLVKGDNVLVYTAETGVTNLVFRVEHRVAYEGV